jgi:hypothetical protein
MSSSIDDSMPLGDRCSWDIQSAVSNIFYHISPS